MTKSYNGNVLPGVHDSNNKQQHNCIPLDQCSNKLCTDALQYRDSALKRLKEMTVFKSSRKKKYIESCALLEKAGNILYNCRDDNNNHNYDNYNTNKSPSHKSLSNSNSNISNNTAHCHCIEAGECFSRAAYVYYDKLHLADSAYHNYLTSAKCYASCNDNRYMLHAYHQLLHADHSRKEAGLTDRELHIELASLLHYVSKQLWDINVKIKSITALEISLSCHTRALVSKWSSDISDRLHNVRVELADKHVSIAMLGVSYKEDNTLQNDSNMYVHCHNNDGKSGSNNNDTALTPRITRDHWSRGKELYEQAARFFPGRYLLRREISKVLHYHKNDTICELIAAYAVERDSITTCLFRASLCDTIICNRDHLLPDRALVMPRILQRYCMVSRSFTASPECKLIRAISGLLYLSTICPVNLNSPHKNLILTAWSNELTNEYERVTHVYKQQVTNKVVQHIENQLVQFIKQCIVDNINEMRS